ncbi:MULTISPECIES: endolytic transglycosylase MltG [unclassified Leptotrichia]|uniref:endolytic transglycosylase MltG n=1 Tax=unclassified Leptotrichia TaxID=2633022 RepID=UPI0003ADB322|nr:MULTISPECIES: endolytic transglycosylase MltG [unclassified Leptotrichia]ERL25044.1 YceG family protein [Leptotrichia sp. oral taxon 225 str. F0581]WLD73208.1 endolytic transglycosylase MltG [Leptotrichia sp. HMT-225]
MKNTLRIVYVVIFLILFMCLALFYNFFAAKKEYKNVNINVKKGTTFTQIYEDLKLNYGIIDRIYLKLNGGNIKLKVGTYKFNGKFSKYEIIKKIKNSETNGVKLTIPEGFTSKQLFARMEALELGTTEEINKVLSEVDFPYPHENNNFEGYFYPETYIFSENVTTKQVIQTILAEFLKKFPPEKYPDKQKFYDTLKMASIVEAEVPDAVDKPKVAGIFLKRLEIGMRLESDATLKYELGRQATRNELKQQNTPYNSYKVKGLPPTPIGNPPIETFKAVLNAEKTDNLFFFTHKGKTYYSKTHQEHLQKRRESGQLK